MEEKYDYVYTQTHSFVDISNIRKFHSASESNFGVIHCFWLGSSSGFLAN